MTPLSKRILDWMLNLKVKYSYKNGTKTFLEPKFFSIYSQI